MTQVRWSDYGAFGGVLCCKCGPPLAIHTPLLAFSKGIPKSQAFSDGILKWTIWCVNLILHSKNGIRKFWHSQIEPRTGWHFQMKYSLFVFWHSQMESYYILAFSNGILYLTSYFRHSQMESFFLFGILKRNPTLMYTRKYSFAWHSQMES